MLPGSSFMQRQSVLQASNGSVLSLTYTRSSTKAMQLFTSVNQSPCDVAVELGGICVAGRECGVRMPLCDPRLIVCRIQCHSISCWQRIFWSQRGYCEQLQMQLSILFIAERLRLLSTAQLHSVDTPTFPGPVQRFIFFALLGGPSTTKTVQRPLLPGQ